MALFYTARHPPRRLPSPEERRAWIVIGEPTSGRIVGGHFLPARGLFQESTTPPRKEEAAHENSPARVLVPRRDVDFALRRRRAAGRARLGRPACRAVGTSERGSGPDWPRDRPPSTWVWTLPTHTTEPKLLVASDMPHGSRSSRGRAARDNRWRPWAFPIPGLNLRRAVWTLPTRPTTSMCGS